MMDLPRATLLFASFFDMAAGVQRARVAQNDRRTVEQHEPR